MNLIFTLYVAILFFVLSPGVLLTLPPKSKKIIVVGTHAILFAFIFHFTQKFVWNSIQILEGFIEELPTPTQQRLPTPTQQRLPTPTQQRLPTPTQQRLPTPQRTQKLPNNTTTNQTNNTTTNETNNTTTNQTITNTNKIK